MKNTFDKSAESIGAISSRAYDHGALYAFLWMRQELDEKIGQIERALENDHTTPRCTEIIPPEDQGKVYSGDKKE